MILKLKKYKLTFFVLIIFFGIFGLADFSLAATGTAGSTGGVYYAEGIDGIVGWARGAGGEVISVDYYITHRDDPLTATSWLCSAGTIPADKSLPDGNNRFSGNQGRLFAHNDNCLQNLADGDYDLYLALGPNIFAILSPPNPQFMFSVKTLNNINNTRLWGHYLGVLVNRSSNYYESYPTVIKDGNTYKMWYAAFNYISPTTYGDSIFYAESTNGINWNLINNNGPVEDHGAVLTPTKNFCVIPGDGSPSDCSGCVCAGDDMHTADPSVIKAGNTYYMYYTGASKKYGNFGSGGSIFMATSSDGVHWSKNSSSGLPLAVISAHIPCPTVQVCNPNSGFAGWYGAGQSSLIYRDYNNDGQRDFMHYFSDFSNEMAPYNTMASSLAISGNGNSFSRLDDGVMGEATWDMKFSSYLNKYVAFAAMPFNYVNHDSSGKIMMSISDSGRRGTWQIMGSPSGPRTVLFNMDSFVGADHWSINNGGLLGDQSGIINGRNTIYYFGAGTGMQPEHDTWDIAGIDVWFAKDSDNDTTAPAAPGGVRIN